MTRGDRRPRPEQRGPLVSPRGLVVANPCAFVRRPAPAAEKQNQARSISRAQAAKPRRGRSSAAMRRRSVRTCVARDSHHGRARIATRARTLASTNALADRPRATSSTAKMPGRTLPGAGTPRALAHGPRRTSRGSPTPSSPRSYEGRGQQALCACSLRERGSAPCSISLSAVITSRESDLARAADRVAVRPRRPGSCPGKGILGRVRKPGALQLVCRVSSRAAVGAAVAGSLRRSLGASDRSLPRSPVASVTRDGAPRLCGAPWCSCAP